MENEIEIMDTLLKGFKDRSMRKFLKGRIDHNDELSKLDFDNEILDELCDLVIYLLLKKHYENKNKKETS